jgi:hypothetical protein
MDGFLNELEHEDGFDGEAQLSYELEAFGADPFDGEDEADQFFKKALKRAGGFLRKAGLPGLLKTLAPVAGKVAGGLLGPAGAQIGGKLGSLAGGLLREDEAFDGFDGFDAFGLDGELDSEDESESELLQEDRPQAFGLDGFTDSLAEELAAQAAVTESDAEAAALLGGVTIHICSPAPITVRRVSPELVRCTTRLGRFLRRRPRTRPLVRALPTIERRAVRMLTKRAQNGGKITPALARTAVAKATVQTLRSPRAAARSLANNAVKRTRLNKPAIARAER